HLLGPAHERNDLGRRLRAGAHGRHRRRQAGHLHEATARDAVAVRVGVFLAVRGDVERAARELVGRARDGVLAVALLRAAPVLWRGTRLPGNRQRPPPLAVLWAGLLVVVGGSHRG